MNVCYNYHLIVACLALLPNTVSDYVQEHWFSLSHSGHGCDSSQTITNNERYILIWVATKHNGK